MLSDIKNVLTDPKKFFEEEIAGLSLKDSLILLGTGGLFYGLIGTLAVYPSFRAPNYAFFIAAGVNSVISIFSLLLIAAMLTTILILGKKLFDEAKLAREEFIFVSYSMVPFMVGILLGIGFYGLNSFFRVLNQVTVLRIAGVMFFVGTVWSLLFITYFHSNS